MQELIGIAGPGAIVSLFLVLVARGQLVPRSTLEDVRKDRDDRLREAQSVADMWRTAYEEERKRGDVAVSQSRELLQQGRTTNALIAATQKVAETSKQATS